MGDHGPPRNLASRWRKRCLFPLAVIIGVLLGLVVLEPLSRPRETGLVEGPQRQKHRDEPPESLGFPPSTASPAPVTAAQLTDEAKQVADRLVEQFPESPHALTLAGSIYLSFGEKAAADRCWDKAVTIAPDFAPTSQRMGVAAWKRGEYDLAVSHLQRAIAADPSSISPLAFVLAESLMNLGNTEEAIDLLEQAARQSPLSVDEIFLLGHGYLQMEQYDKARDRFVAGLLVDPASSKIHFGLATVYARLGQLDASRKHREEYARLQSQKLDKTTAQRGALRAGDLGDMHPFALMTYVNAGKIHAAQGDIRQAEKYWLRAVEVDPQHHEPRRWLELLYTEEGRQEEAARIRQGANSGQEPLKEARDE